MPTPADLAQALWTALQHVRHYRPDHPSAALAVRRCADALREAAPIRIAVEPHRLLIQDQPLSAADPVVASLRAYLEARGVQGVGVERSATAEAVAAFVRVLAREPEEIIAAGGLRDALQEAGVRGITVGPPVPRPPAGGDPYGAAVQTAAAVAADVSRGEPVDLPRVRAVVADLIQVARADPLSLWARVADRGHDETDPPHAVNTAALTIWLASAVGASGAVLTDLATAAFLHDIGLAAVPYPRRLAERTAGGPSASWQHPAVGAYLLRRLAHTAAVVPVVAAEHHLPSVGGEACAHARLVSLADYVDALTCGRAPALRPMGVGTLVSSLLDGAGPAFDPLHVRVLASLLAQAASAGVTLAPS
jgi:hypothetical protein